MPDLASEVIYRHLGMVAGADEAGRGPLCGCVTAAGVVLPDKPSRELLRLLDDSKKLSKAARAEAEAAIKETCLYAVASSSVQEILQLNILHASMLAMRRAIQMLDPAPSTALIDGNRCPVIDGIKMVAIVGGDGKSYSIAAASILAKEDRDREIAKLAEAFPGYGWERNAGYGTPEHLDALKRLGPTPHHRIGFAPVKAVLAVRAAAG